MTRPDLVAENIELREQLTWHKEHLKQARELIDQRRLELVEVMKERDLLKYSIRDQLLSDRVVNAAGCVLALQGRVVELPILKHALKVAFDLAIKGEEP